MNKARVIAEKFLTPTVRWFKLETLNSTSQRFYAGQWLDLHIPGSDIIGGYSMCSSPVEFDKSGTFELAVKVSDHPAATWMHTECSIGMELSYKFGGDVYLNDTNLPAGERSYLLMAGGVGINPIYSILQAIITRTTLPTTLLYSAKTRKELMFYDEINMMAEKHPQMSVKYFLSAASDADHRDAESFAFGRRMNESDVAEALREWPVDQVDSFICGPDEMITSMDACLQRHHVPRAQIHYERWT